MFCSCLYVVPFYFPPLSTLITHIQRTTNSRFSRLSLHRVESCDRSSNQTPVFSNENNLHPRCTSLRMLPFENVNIMELTGLTLSLQMFTYSETRRSKKTNIKRSNHSFLYQSNSVITKRCLVRLSWTGVKEKLEIKPVYSVPGTVFVLCGPRLAAN